MNPAPGDIVLLSTSGGGEKGKKFQTVRACVRVRAWLLAETTPAPQTQKRDRRESSWRELRLHFECFRMQGLMWCLSGEGGFEEGYQG